MSENHELDRFSLELLEEKILKDQDFLDELTLGAYR